MNDAAKRPIYGYCCMTEYDNLACIDVVHLVAFGCDGWSWYLLLKFVFDWCHICVILVNIYTVMLFFFEIQMKCCQNFEFYVVSFFIPPLSPNTRTKPTRFTFQFVPNTGMERTYSSGIEPFHSVPLGSSTKHTLHLPRKTSCVSLHAIVHDAVA